MLPSADEILANFELLDDWEERYRYLIELGRMMPALPEEARTDQNKVMGCASQVWLESRTERPNGEPILRLRGESDAHIVRGLIALPSRSSPAGRPQRSRRPTRSRPS